MLVRRYSDCDIYVLNQNKQEMFQIVTNQSDYSSRIIFAYTFTLEPN